MRLSLITVKRRPDSDDVSRRETLLEGEELRVGRAIDADVNLPDIDVASHHATLSASDQGLVLSAVGGSNVTVDGKPVDNVVLGPGVTARIGPFELTGEPAPDHADAAVALSKVEVEAVVSAGKERIADVMPSRRRLSWLLIAAVLAVFVVWPLTEILKRGAPGPDEIVVAGMVPASQAATPVSFSPMEESWISGPMSKAHAELEENCAACHLRPFEMTTNNACLACHADVATHGDLKEHPVLEADQSRCAACHKEHEGGDAPVEEASAFCTTCHADLKATSNMADLGDATDFGTNHPVFRPSLVIGVQEVEGRLAPITLRSAPDAVRPWSEKSGLKFPHDVHLNVKGVRGLGRASDKTWDMTCASCHQTEADGDLMRPIQMERDCGYCHELTFQPDNIDELREIPHAMPQQVSEIVHDYYQARVLEGGMTVPGAPDGARRRPGTRMSEEDRAESLAWANQAAERELTAIMEGRLCGDCHVAQRAEQPDPRGRAVWQVEGALVQRHWMPLSDFAHEPHFAMDCVSCHKATESKASTDVLMPDINLCRDCHAGEETTQATASSNCLACHDFHYEKYGPMSPAHGEAFTARRLAAERVEVKREAGASQ